MAAKRAVVWVLGLGLGAALPLAAALAQDPETGLAPPDLPAALVLTEEPAPPAVPAGRANAEPEPRDPAPLPTAAADPTVPPGAPEPAVVRPAVAAAAPADAGKPEPAVSPPVTVTGTVPPATPAAPTLADRLPGVIEARLADPKLPLPPKLSRQAREELAAFYRAAGFKPLWLTDGAWNGAARSVLAELERAGRNGLDPADYPAPSLIAGAAPLSDAEFAEAELKVSAIAFLYARDARGGRIDPARISGLITPKLELPTPSGVLAALAGSEDPGSVIEGFNPRYPGYQALRDKLAEIRANRPETPVARAPAGLAGRAGLASRAGLAVQAVADLGPEGRSAVRLPAATGRLEGDIVANMERWRWLPATVAPRSINVNIPEYRLRLIDDGRVTHETRVITGRPTTPTPVFSGLMEYAIVNPSWFIPPSILKKEILPGLAKDPNYAARRGYQVVRRGNAVSVRQPPGAGNALGYIKFMFPNDHAVYLHDTPSRGLFASGTRAFSHGCVRVENPFALGGQILGGTWTEGRLKSLIGYGERTIFLAEKLPVNLTYFTTAVDESGALRSFDDIYGYNRRVRMALGLGA